MLLSCFSRSELTLRCTSAQSWNGLTNCCYKDGRSGTNNLIVLTLLLNSGARDLTREFCLTVVKSNESPRLARNKCQAKCRVIHAIQKTLSITFLHFLYCHPEDIQHVARILCVQSCLRWLIKAAKKMTYLVYHAGPLPNRKHNHSGVYSLASVFRVQAPHAMT